MARLMDTPELTNAAILLPELLVLVASSLLLIFSLASFFVLGIVFRKTCRAAVAFWQDSSRKRINSAGQLPSQHHISLEMQGSQEIIQFNGAPNSASSQWNGVAKTDLFARHL